LRPTSSSSSIIGRQAARRAIDELFKLFKEKHPDVNILENPVAGGGGANMLAVLMGNLESGIRLIFPGSSGQPQKSYMMPVIWEESTISGKKPILKAALTRPGSNV
jgi:hypothetical protein